jgi:hypothetical protein
MVQAQKSEIILSSLFVKNRADSPLLMRADILSDLTNVSERSAQRIQFIFNSIFYAGWHQMIVMETTCLQTVEIYYCGGYVPLFVRQIFFQSSQM